MRIFAVVNQKGGCGKTTTSINLAGVFAARGYKTLLVDMDPQGHCAAGLAIPEQRVDLHIGDAMLAPDDQPVDMQRLLWRVSRNLDLAPSTVRLAALEAPRGELASRTDAHQRLKSVLNRVDGQYDICLIDCSPSIGLLAFNALVAAHEVLIPVETGFFSLQGASKQVNAIKSIGKHLGVQPVHRLLATMHDESSVLSQDLLEELRRRFGNRVLPVVIRSDQSLREAASFGQPAADYAPESSGAADYAALADYLIEHSLNGAADELEDADEPTIPAKDAPAAPSNRSALTSARLPSTAGSVTATTVLNSGPSRTIVIEPLADEHDASNGPMNRAADIAARTRKLQVAARLTTPPAAAAVPAKPMAPAAIEQRVVQAETPVAAAATAPTFGVQLIGRMLVFRQPLTLGHQVAVAGDFNGWSDQRTPLKVSQRSGALEACIELPAGMTLAQYRLVVDGKWMPDPFNPTTSVNPFGGFNSVIHAPATSTATLG